MNTPQSYASIVGLGIALLITLPCAADEQDAAQNKLYPSAKSIAVRQASPSRTFESPSMPESVGEANSTPKKSDVPDPTTTPYMTYEGATSSNSDR